MAATVAGLDVRGNVLTIVHIRARSHAVVLAQVDVKMVAMVPAKVGAMVVQAVEEHVKTPVEVVVNINKNLSS